jgi:hypothetical protein
MTNVETINLEILLSRYLHKGCNTKGGIPLDCGMVIKFQATWSAAQETHLVEYQVDNAIISVFDSTHIEDCYYIDNEVYNYLKPYTRGEEGNIHKVMQQLYRSKRNVRKAKIFISFADVTEVHYLFNRYEMFM